MDSIHRNTKVNTNYTARNDIQAEPIKHEIVDDDIYDDDYC